ALKEAISRVGFEAILSGDGQDALQKLNQSSFSMIVTDMKMPRMDGLSLLKEIRHKIGHIPILVITGFGTIQDAVEVMKEGASDYLLKPFSFEALMAKIRLLMERIHQERGLITENQKMLQLIRIAEEVAPSDTSVLIYGESGTGKELLAGTIHKKSRRSHKPLVAINCAAIPDSLMESELFGHEKGAFTGATEKKIGKFEFANQGTLLLDEIGEMSLNLQAKLLRVLQEREINRVGGNQAIPIDIRVIATTNRDLYKDSQEGKFREDLYYRLNVFPLHIPPLRERPDDIALLSRHFLKKFSGVLGKNLQGFTPPAMDFLITRSWRGNIRELQNTIQRSVHLSKGDLIDLTDFMVEAESVPALSSPGKIKDLEKDMILKTLKEVNGNKTRAARILGVSVRTIRNKLHEYGDFFPVPPLENSEGAPGNPGGR
ncbi:MAG: sigma-54-dependent Fis family transcriptional regulator, partial [Deltaproteobacteria bacterium]|nr:sigma-54-dependent Fis family transcriptional regulator [Deltaproteobacteria bacterium]